MLVVLHRLDIGGTQINALDFAKAAYHYGIDSYFVGYSNTLPAFGPTLVHQAQSRGIHIEIIDGSTNRCKRAQQLSILSKRLDIHLVHVYSSWGIPEVYWGPCLFARLPFVITVYEMGVRRWLPRGPELIVGTQYLLEELQSTRGKVHLISPPVDLLQDHPTACSRNILVDETTVSHDKIKISVVSRLDPHMKEFGIRVAMRAIERLGSGVVLIIVGGGPAEHRLQAEGDSINSSLGRNAIVFTGPMSDPRPVYADSDIILGMGGSAARALSFAKPLVCIGEYGFSMTFQPESSKALFRNSFWSNDVVEQPVERLVDQLIPLINDADERMRLGVFGRQFAEDNFGLSSMTLKLLSVYQEAVDSYGLTQWLSDILTEPAGLLCALVSGQKLLAGSI